MILVATVILLHSAGLAGSMPGSPGVPANITVTFLNPTSVRVTWATVVPHVEKYDVIYKPTDARVVDTVAGNSDAVTLSGLKPDTQYQVIVAAIWNGKKLKTRPIVFRTLILPEDDKPKLVPNHPPQTSPHTDVMGTFATEPPSSTTYSEPPHVEYPQPSSTVRGVEIGIVLLVLVVWIAAIALFFNRWGKIRMLLPYQPDYKQEQLKVPGTAACAAAVASGNACGHASTEHVCTQLMSTSPGTALVAVGNCITVCPVAGTTIIKPRARLNSAIFTSISGPGFDSKEFFRRHGSQSRLCRKARSVDNLSTSTDDDGTGHKHHIHHRVHNSAAGTSHFGLPVLSISGPSPPEAATDDTTTTAECCCDTEDEDEERSGLVEEDQCETDHFLK